MNMIPVDSNNLAAVGYDQSSQTLVIQFHSGTYKYTSVPKHIYDGLMSSSSKGKYHHANIKNDYRYVKIG